MRAYFVTLLTLSLTSAALQAQDKPNLKDPRQRSSYALGADIGNTFKRQELDIDGKALAAGIADGLAGKAALTEAEIRQILTELEKNLSAKAEEKDKAVAQKNAKEGEAFLAANGKKEGVRTTPSGLQYKVLKSGTGQTPKSTDSVKVHYKGTLIDGTVFDSSIDRGQPVEFPVMRVIPGWTEALQLMKEGDKWQLFIPSKLAYGERGPDDKIGPNATLLFEVELLTVTKKP